MRIAVDVMGGDLGAQEVVEGSLSAASEGVELVLVGDKSCIQPWISRKHLPSAVEVQHACQVIEMVEPPSSAVRHKSDSSLVIAMRMLGEGRVDAVVTPGNTGAALAAASIWVGRMPNIDRPAIAVVFPSKTGRMVMIDVGANVDCKPNHLLQFAMLGTTYAQSVLLISNPRVGLLNIGEEPIKGNEIARAAYSLLCKAPLHFIGNVEGRDLLSGAVDVVVVDGFVGNIVLKTAEGCADFIWGELKSALQGSWLAKAAVWLFLRRCLRQLGRRLDWREYGGAPLLGINGVCVIAHGTSDQKAISRAVQVARETVNARAVEHMQRALKEVSVLEQSVL